MEVEEDEVGWWRGGTACVEARSNPRYEKKLYYC